MNPDRGFTARCLFRAAAASTLVTQGDDQPFASLVTHAMAPDGSLLLWLSTLSRHTRQLAHEPRCARIERFIVWSHFPSRQVMLLGLKMLCVSGRIFRVAK
ncbi:MAG: hypothetical protein ACKO9A_18030 [Alphaproteobacteria bacterium]